MVMECNKEEGIRAKQLAEKKLTEDDFWGAKRLALKAQRLFPGLEGLSQFQEILDVHISREKMINGEVDWYEILGVDPLADNETIKKRYRKLALQLHPDKNKSVGADGAFKIISEAWSLLSDKESRDTYNLRWNVRAAYKMADYVNPPAGPGKRTRRSFTHSSCKARSPSARKKSLRNWKASCKKGKGKTSVDNAGKSSFTNNSSSTIDPATPDDFQQDTGTSYQKDAHQDTPASDGKSGHKAFSNGAFSTKNVATAEDSSHSVPSASPPPPPPPPVVNRSETYWGGCSTCGMMHTYTRRYNNTTCCQGSSNKLPCRQKQELRVGGSSSEVRSVSSAGEPAAQDKTE